MKFPKIARTKPNETIFFSFIIYKSRAHRDAVNKKVTSYFNKKYADQKHKDMLFDMKRVAYGGFKAIVEE